MGERKVTRTARIREVIQSPRNATDWQREMKCSRDVITKPKVIHVAVGSRREVESSHRRHCICRETRMAAMAAMRVHQSARILGRLRCDVRASRLTSCSVCRSRAKSLE